MTVLCALGWQCVFNARSDERSAFAELFNRDAAAHQFFKHWLVYISTAEL